MPKSVDIIPEHDIIKTVKRDAQIERRYKMMYTVQYFDDGIQDDMVVFMGSLADCIVYKDDDNDFYIVAPDGFTVVG